MAALHISVTLASGISVPGNWGRHLLLTQEQGSSAGDLPVTGWEPRFESARSGRSV